MATIVTDEAELILAGDNPWTLLYDGDRIVANASLWRVRYSPVGIGNVLLWFCEENTDGRPQILADSPQLGAWVRDTIWLSIPFIAERYDAARDDGWLTQARFDITETRDELTATVTPADGTPVVVSWSQFGVPFFGQSLAAEADETLSHSAAYVPAELASISGARGPSSGRPIPRERGPYASSSAFLALSESWTRRTVPTT